MTEASAAAPDEGLPIDNLQRLVAMGNIREGRVTVDEQREWRRRGPPQQRGVIRVVPADDRPAGLRAPPERSRHRPLVRPAQRRALVLVEPGRPPGRVALGEGCRGRAGALQQCAPGTGAAACQHQAQEGLDVRLGRVARLRGI